MNWSIFQDGNLFLAMGQPARDAFVQATLSELKDDEFHVVFRCGFSDISVLARSVVDAVAQRPQPAPSLFVEAAGCGQALFDILVTEQTKGRLGSTKVRHG